MRRAVFPHQLVAEQDRHQAGDGHVAIEQEVDIEHLAEARCEIAEPRVGLRRHALRRARQHVQLEVRVDEGAVAAYDVTQLTALGPSDVLAVVVPDALEERLEIRSQVDRVVVGGLLGFESGQPAARDEWSSLHIPPSAAPRLGRDAFENLPKTRGIVDERLAVVRERQRDEAPAGEPARDDAERYRAAQVLAALGIADRREAVGASERVEPLGRVERGRARILPHALAPAPVDKRVEGADHRVAPAARAAPS